MNFHFAQAITVEVSLFPNRVFSFSTNFYLQPDNNNETDIKLTVIKCLTDNKALINEENYKIHNKKQANTAHLI